MWCWGGTQQPRSWDRTEERGKRIKREEQLGVLGGGVNHKKKGKKVKAKE